MNYKGLLIIFFFLNVLQCTDGFSRAIRISSDLPLQTQLNEPGATYVFKGDYNLDGQTIICPNGCVLLFKKSCCIHNGRIVGNNTEIKSKKNVNGFFDKVYLSGSFSNKEAYLSWWIIEEDVTEEVNSLTASFDGLIYLDRSGTLTDKVYISGKESVVLDGCNNLFTLNNISNNCFFAQKNHRIEFRNININFSGCNTSGSSSIIRCFRIEHSGFSSISVHDISISGFSNINDLPCSFVGVNVVNCEKGTQTVLYGIKISNIKVKGDGIEVSGPGANYGLVIACQREESGLVEVYNCSFTRLSNVNSVGEAVYEDTSGIYFSGMFLEDGIKRNCHWNAYLHDCSFVDISKRNVKVQGDYVRIIGLQSDCTESFLQDYKNMYVGAEGNHLEVEKLRGRYDGTIVKITGDFLTAKDIDCSSFLRDSHNARVFTLDGCLHADISDCTFHNDSYIFIYPTEKGMHDNDKPYYSFRNCSLTVKHLLYCNSSQKLIFQEGVLEVSDCDINLSNLVCSNGKALKEIRFNRTHLNHKGNLTAPSRDVNKVTIIDNKSVFKEVFDGSY